MTKDFTLEEAFKLVDFVEIDGEYRVLHVKGDVVGHVCGNVWGNVEGNVAGNVWGNVEGNVKGNVEGHVFGTINKWPWQFIEAPEEKLRRLIEEGADKKQLINALDQLEDN